MFLQRVSYLSFRLARNNALCNFFSLEIVALSKLDFLSVTSPQLGRLWEEMLNHDNGKYFSLVFYFD